MLSDALVVLTVARSRDLITTKSQILCQLENTYAKVEQDSAWSVIK